MVGNSGVDDLPIWVKEIVDDQSITCYSYSLWFNSTGLVHQRQSEIKQFCILLAKISTTKSKTQTHNIQTFGNHGIISQYIFSITE